MKTELEVIRLNIDDVIKTSLGTDEGAPGGFEEE